MWHLLSDKIYNASMNSKYLWQLVTGKMSNPFINRKFFGNIPKAKCLMLIHVWFESFLQQLVLVKMYNPYMQTKFFLLQLVSEQDYSCLNNCEILRIYFLYLHDLNVLQFINVIILSSVKIGQHLESVTILEYAVTWVQLSMTSFILQTASRNR